MTKLITSDNSLSSPRYIEIPPEDVGPAPGNREVTLELVGDLMPSMKQNGQLFPGIVYPNAHAPPQWFALAGNRRRLCCEVLRILFKALALSAAPSEEFLIKLQLTEDRIRKGMTGFDVAWSIQRFVDLRKCTLEQAGREFGIAPSTVCKMIRPLRRLPEDVLLKLSNQSICRAVASELARLDDPAKIREYADLAEQGLLTRDAVKDRVNNDLGKGKGKGKPTKLTQGKVVVIIPADVPNKTAIERLEVMIARLKRGSKLTEDGEAPVLLPAGWEATTPGM